MSKKSGKPGPDPGTGGRPKIEVNKDTVDKLCEIQCTQDEICNVLGVSMTVLHDRIREWTNDKSMTFVKYFKQKADSGKVSLRRRQWNLSIKNVAMAIFLGKQYLGQKDVKQVDAKLNVRNIDINLTPEEEAEYKQRMSEFSGIDFEGEDDA